MISRLTLKGLLIAATAGSGLLALAPEIADAQELVARPVNDTLVESYDTDAPSSGAALAGITIGNPTGPLDVAIVRIPAAEEVTARVCVTGRTRDGRYYSENVYLVPESPSSDALARLDPLTQRHASKLQRYKARQFSVKAGVVTENCGESVSYFVPWVVERGSRLLRLQLRTAVQGTWIDAFLLSQTGKAQLGKFRCAPAPGDAGPAFDTECTVKLADDLARRGGFVALKVVADGGFDPIEDTYLLRLPVIGGTQ